MTPQQPPPTQPPPDGRPAPRTRRNPEQTRARILDAAVAEFGEKGYAGARTAAIAKRAGVNQQLIAYYFGGKRGLLDELRVRWAEKQRALAPTGAKFTDGFAAYLDATLDEPDWARLVVWQALGDSREDDRETAATTREQLQRGVERTRGRQAAGEISGRLEPEFVVPLAHALAFAPIAMPQIVEGIFGVDPLSSEYRRRCREQLARIVEPEPEPEPESTPSERSLT